MSDGESVDIFGLFTFTNCEETFKEDCSNALLNEQRMLTHNVQKKYSEKVRLCFHDVQNSQENLIEFLMPLVDGEQYTVECRNNETFIPYFERLFIMTYVSFELTRLASFLVLPLDFPLFGITQKEIYPAYYLDHELGLFSYQSSFGAEMHRHGFIKLKNELKVSYGAILNVYDDEKSRVHENEVCDINNKDSAWCLYTSECPGDCYKEINVKSSNQTDINHKLELLRKHNMSFIILSCESAFVSRFLKEFSLSESIYFLPFSRKMANETTQRSIEMTSYYNTDVLVYFPGTFAFNSLIYYLFNMTDLMLHSESIWDGIMEDNKVQAFIRTKIPCHLVQTIFPSYNCKDSFTYQMWLKVPESFKKLLVNQMVKTKAVLKSMCTFFKLRFYMQYIDYTHLTNQYMFNPAKGLKLKPFCELKKPTCKAGQRLVHSLYKDPNWDRSKGWNCQLCPKHYYKRKAGNDESCIKCEYPFKTNPNHTQCFDPYNFRSLRYTDPLVISLMLISGAIFVAILFTMLLFVIKKNTPIVLSSNRQMTILQLTMHLILAVVPLYLYVGEVKTARKCILRQLVIGISFTVTISVNISKTQKLFMIIQKKIVMSRSEILLTKASEWVIIIVMLLLNISIHLAKLFYSSFQVSTEYHDFPTLIKEHYCSNEMSIFLQIIFAGGLIVINGIQGIRGRKLPSQFRETNHVIYSSFISMVLIFSMVGIFLSRKYHTDKEIVVLVVTVLLNSVHFSLLYFYKVYVILFKPRLNSRDFVKQRRLNQMMKTMRQ